LDEKRYTSQAFFTTLSRSPSDRQTFFTTLPRPTDDLPPEGEGTCDINEGHLSYVIIAPVIPAAK
jgi:hypothetical protein